MVVYVCVYKGVSSTNLNKSSVLKNNAEFITGKVFYKIMLPKGGRIQSPLCSSVRLSVPYLVRQNYCWRSNETWFVDRWQ